MLAQVSAGAQPREIARIDTDAAANRAAAVQRLATMQAALTALTPDMGGRASTEALGRAIAETI